MPIIVTANQKGGVGKTAIAANLAHGIKRELGGDVLVVDADPAASLTKQFIRRGSDPLPYSLTQATHGKLHETIPDLIRKGKYENTVIDCPAGDSNITRSALFLANLVVIPVQPSYCDFDAAEVFLPLLSHVAVIRPDIQVMVVISRKMPGSNNYSKEARSAAQAIFKFDDVRITVAKQEIANRVDVVKAYTCGQTIFEFAPGSIAALEFGGLSEEIAACLIAATV